MQDTTIPARATGQAGSGVLSEVVTSDERWLSAVWPFVRDALPAAPARVVEIGCGPLGGFVPRLESAGYEATGVDPEAPSGSSYRQVEFEYFELPPRLDAVVACTSMHHVADLAEVLDLVHAALAPGGSVVMVEWVRERFDEATARWCFDRLPEAVDLERTDHDHGDHHWLAHRRGEWLESGQPWDACLRSWAQAEGMHPWADILDQLDARFERGRTSYGPYFFADLVNTSEGDEQAAIDSGLIQANRVQYQGRRRRQA
jgi:SAM-dependent methyltransferase